MTLNSLAVRVSNVSKIYRLWGTGRARLFFALRRLLLALTPKIMKIQAQTSKHYDEFYALNSISFEIQKGESWGFIGLNGSGKSTLLKIISGNLRPSHGQVEVEGKIVILDYGNGFNGDFTGKENIYIKAALFGLTKKQISERYNSIVEFAELGDFINQPVKTYSSGMISRLGFAVIAHVDADIIITDEALAVGDVFFVQKCMAFIREFLKNGTFLFVSHSTNDVLSLCQKAIWLEHGVIKAIGSAPEVTGSYLDQTHMKNAKDILLNQAINLQPININENIKNSIALEQPMLSLLMDYHHSPNYNDPIFNTPLNLHSQNDIQIIQCDCTGESGIGGAKILSARLCDEEGNTFSWILGGQIVTLVLEILAEQELASPIIGFQVIDSSGQVIFADNSYLITQHEPFVIRKGTIFITEFKYRMPILTTNNYTVRAAVAIGKDEGNAILLQTVDTALIFSSKVSPVTSGLIGIPMKAITLQQKCIANF